MIRKTTAFIPIIISIVSIFFFYVWTRKACQANMLLREYRSGLGKPGVSEIYQRRFRQEIGWVHEYLIGAKIMAVISLLGTILLLSRSFGEKRFWSAIGSVLFSLLALFLAFLFP